MYMHPLLAMAALAGPPRDTVPLYTDLGDHHVAITTHVGLTQRYFDQGMRLLYGFNHGEAIRSFTRAAQLDSSCAMCYWGIAYACGPHVNAGMDSAAGVAAYTALRQALARMQHASPREQAYITALAHRYAAPPIRSADRAALDSAYAASMGEVVRRYPTDLDAATLYAEALMDKRPWNYWDKKTGEPYPGTREIVRQLERVLRSDPRHPGACHYYIHAVEAVAPEKAVPCAERLAALMPGAGHLVHMPAHIYIRVGRYADAIAANEHAVHADEVFIEGQKPHGLYPLAYYPHNHHFQRALAGECCGERQEVMVVRVVGQRVQAVRLLSLDEDFVGVDGVLIGRDRVGVASHADVDVGGHVDEMSRARHQCREPLGARHRLLRRDGFHGMDVVMARARMAGVGPQDALELGHDLRGPGIRLPRLLVPVVPRTLIHQRLGVQRRRVQVVGVPLDDVAHGGRVGRIERRTLGGWDRRIPLREGVDVGPLPGARGPLAREGLLDGLVCRESSGGVHPRVHVWAVRVGHPPIAHGAVRVQLRGMVEGADGLAVVETVQQSHPLVEVPLSQGDRGRDRDVMVAQVGVERDRITGWSVQRYQDHQQW